MKKDTTNFTVKQSLAPQVVCLVGAGLFTVLFISFLLSTDWSDTAAWNAEDLLLHGVMLACILFFLILLRYFRRPWVRVKGDRVFFYPRLSFMRETDAETLRTRGQVRRKVSGFRAPVGGVLPLLGVFYAQREWFYPEQFSYYVDGKLMLRYNTTMKNHDLLTLLLSKKEEGFAEVTYDSIAVCARCGAKYLNEGSGCPACGHSATEKQ